MERSFQLTVDTILDINMHFISELGLKVPDNFQSTFGIISSQMKIFPEEFADKIAPSVGLRNRLVHRYEEIKPKFFVEQVKKEYKDFVKYLDIYSIVIIIPILLIWKFFRKILFIANNWIPAYAGMTSIIVIILAS